MIKRNQQFIICFLTVCFVFGASAVLAADSTGVVSNLSNSVPTELASRSKLITVIGGLVKNISAVLGVALALIIIYAGITWGWLAQGDPIKIAKAKQMIKNAIIGLLIVAAAYAITYFVVNDVIKETVSFIHRC